MSFTCTGLLSGQGGLESITFQHTYSRVYRFNATNRDTDDEKACLVAIETLLGFVPYASHPTDSKARVLNISAQTVSAYNNGPINGLLWDATIDFGPVNPLTQGQSDPTEQPIRWRLDPITLEIPVFVDYNGDPVVNSAGDPFDPPLTQETTQYMLTFLRNEVSIDVVSLVTQSGKGQVNESEWNGFPEKTVKVLPIKIPEKLWSQDTQELYYPMEYVFQINFDTWTRQVIDQGYGELYGTGPAFKRRTIVDGSGETISTPAMLDGAGHQLARPFTHSDIVILKFEINQPIDFTVFDLDGDLT